MKAKDVVFWLLMLAAVVGFWWSVRQGPGHVVARGLGIAAFSIAMQAFIGRFPGSKKWPATVMIGSALIAIAAAFVAVLEFKSFFGSQNDLMGAWIAIAICAISAVAVAWASIRLWKLRLKNPT